MRLCCCLLLFSPDAWHLGAWQNLTHSMGPSCLTSLGVSLSGMKMTLVPSCSPSEARCCCRACRTTPILPRGRPLQRVNWNATADVAPNQVWSMCHLLGSLMFVLWCAHAHPENIIIIKSLPWELEDEDSMLCPWLHHSLFNFYSGWHLHFLSSFHFHQLKTPSGELRPCCWSLRMPATL